MKLSAKTASLALLGAAYLLSVFLVFRHTDRSASPGKVTIRVSQWQLESGVREGIDAVILGCTELCFLVKPEDLNEPLLDTTEIHARAAMDFALAR